MRSRAALALSTLALLWLAACASPQVNPPAANAVELKDNVFAPDALTVATGATVTWKNVGRNSHTVTILDPDDEGGAYLKDQEDPGLGPGESTTFAFTEAGTYKVFCRYHSPFRGGDFTTGMVLRVTVT